VGRPLYEMASESKIGEYIQNDIEFFIIDMEKQRVYSSMELRLRDMMEKLDKETTFIVKEAVYIE
jgi:hypothetical protein